MNYPRVIVLVLSYNGKDLLQDSISSYLANDYPNFEVVIIDNGSNDGTVDYVKNEFPEANVIRIEKNRGYSGGFNYGLEYAFIQKKADYVLITNNDVKADKRVISELVNTAKTDPMIGFTTGKVYYYDFPDILQTVGRMEHKVRWIGALLGGKEKDIGQYEKIAERPFCDDIFWLVNKKVYKVTGGYNPIFHFVAEDSEWQMRAKELGYKMFYTPHAKIWHKDSMTLGKNEGLHAYYRARNPLLAILLHKDADFFRRCFWFEFRKIFVNRSIKALMRLKFRIAFNIWAGFTSTILWGIRNKKVTGKHFVNCTQKPIQ